MQAERIAATDNIEVLRMMGSLASNALAQRSVAAGPLPSATLGRNTTLPRERGVLVFEFYAGGRNVVRAVFKPETGRAFLNFDDCIRTR